MEWLLLVTPFAGGAWCFWIVQDTLRRIVLPLTAAMHFIFTLLIWNGGLRQTTHGWIGVDALGMTFLLTLSFLFMLVAFYTRGYLAEHACPEESGRRLSHEAVFTGSMLVFLGTMTLAIMSLHTGVYWMAIEATTLASAPLIIYQRSSRSLEAVWKYLLICSVGIAMALLGNIALAVSASFELKAGAMPMTFQALNLNAGVLQPIWLKGAFAFFLAGYGTKMGLAPMHTWLPDAHSEAPSPISALLSGALLNCAFLGILRANGILTRAGFGDFSHRLLVLFGLFSMLLAGCLIIRQADFKRLLAYSSIEHMGLLAIAAGACAQTHFGAMLHLVNHSLTKGMLFLTAGNILSAYQTKSARDVSGLLRILPVSGMLWIAGFMAICGAPPFGMFISEISIMYGLGQARQWLVLGLLLLALSVIFIGMSQIVAPMAYGKPSITPPIEPERHGSLWRNLPPLILCGAILMLGVWLPQPLSLLLEQAASMLGGS
ncbi:hypothetical protein JXA32_02605 [Candidatus Sumerlaeota bacterium]|nr:hypothetical protein [Candidatus Sumerlaeota bacterium]